VFVPKKWVGKKVVAIRLEDLEEWTHFFRGVTDVNCSYKILH
jgi:hypothetical protein